MKTISKFKQGKLNQEILMKRIYQKDGKQIIQKFYAERTALENTLVFPFSMIDDLECTDDGYIGKVPEGQYLMGKVLIEPTKVYNVVKPLYGFVVYK